MTDKLAPQQFSIYVDERMRIAELLMVARHTDQIDGITAIIDFLVDELSIYVNEESQHDDLANRVQLLIADLARPVVLH
ncbi:hypothetical protein KZO25_11795 [Halomonas sp. ANAO-440]|uniref:hypothetical protein n=1 Tax=Halomonas sp. ANAO-440 TaxID=2861360 RepID=UPI001CAA5489|nr:hypothetical protein [Halomonas sp. ANAO-440]MBZ0330998.1 hypothetical protein [Halomonas sp. ANAO-440]